MTTPLKPIKLSEFLKDAYNLNRGTDQGRELIGQSIDAVGWGRPIVAAADGTAIAGNHALEEAKKKGMGDPIVIESDGTRPVIHVRTDIKSASDPKAVRMAVLDNRTSAVNLNWDMDSMADILQESDIDPEEVGFHDADFEVSADDLLPEEDEPVSPPAPTPAVAAEKEPKEPVEKSTPAEPNHSRIAESYKVVVSCADEAEQRQLFEKFTAEGYAVTLLTV